MIVSDKGGPQELIEEGITGYRVRGKDVDSLVEAMMKLMDDRTRVRMGQKARQFIEENNIEEPFAAIFCAEEYRQRVKQMRKMKKHHQTQQYALDTIVRIGQIQESDKTKGYVNYAV